MREQLEPSQTNIDAVVVNPGTHYFRVEHYELARIRANIYDAASRTGQFVAHTSYNAAQEELRVVIQG